ncbi:hypothetical protein BKI52_14060 [marine bacterium AO1-C]|nr:hypothetical protein BKI52_14060 [marine bacterium AO1-C]
MLPNELQNWWEHDKQRTHSQQYRSVEELNALLPKRNLWMVTSRLLQHAAIYSFLIFTISGC